jgi:hypothetical protein
MKRGEIGGFVKLVVAAETKRKGLDEERVGPRDSRPDFPLTRK